MKNFSNLDYLSHKGFTLIELVTVMVLLGILSVGISSFLGITSQIFIDTAQRDQLVASGRFSVERLNRELRAALPNSIQVTSQGSCLEFTPIVISTNYTDIPVKPEAAYDEITVIKFIDDSRFTDELRVAVYPLNPLDVYDGSKNKVFALATQTLNTSGNEWTIKLDGGTQHFATDSPTERIYFISNKVSYCLNSAGELSRTEDGGDTVLMAKHIINYPPPLQDPENPPFQVKSATQYRNAMVEVRFIFSRNDEFVTFNNEIQVANVP